MATERVAKGLRWCDVFEVTDGKFDGCPSIPTRITLGPPLNDTRGSEPLGLHDHGTAAGSVIGYAKR